MKTIKLLIAFFFVVSLVSKSQDCNNVCQSGSYIIKGAQYSSATAGNVTAGKAYLSGSYAFGGDVTIKGGLSQNGGTAGSILVSGTTCDGNYPFGGNITITPGLGYTNGKICLNGTTSIGAALYVLQSISAASLTTTGAITAGSLTSNGNFTISTSNATALTLNNTSTTQTTQYVVFNNSGNNMGNIGIDQNANMIVSTGDYGPANINITATNGNVNIAAVVSGSGGGSGSAASVADVNITGSNFKVSSGNVYARKMVVQTGIFPDFVLRKDYKLKSLPETEAYIKANGHLEGVPTEAEAKAKGIDVAEMNATLLKKIEEITLLLIEQNKSIENLKKENDALKAKVEEISNK